MSTTRATNMTLEEQAAWERLAKRGQLARTLRKPYREYQVALRREVERGKEGAEKC